MEKKKLINLNSFGLKYQIPLYDMKRKDVFFELDEASCILNRWLVVYPIKMPVKSCKHLF